MGGLNVWESNYDKKPRLKVILTGVTLLQLVQNWNKIKKTQISVKWASYKGHISCFTSLCKLPSFFGWILVTLPKIFRGRKTGQSSNSDILLCTLILPVFGTAVLTFGQMFPTCIRRHAIPQKVATGQILQAESVCNPLRYRSFPWSWGTHDSSSE